MSQGSNTARVVSGMRPTGRLHLGHLVGALRNWAELQDRYECFYFVADWHALTSEYANTTGLAANAIDNAADWIATGVDPERSTLFIQSLVPEHAELYLLLQMVVPIPWLERVPTYKEQREQLTDKDLSTLGFLGYPLLQAADIAIYDGKFVPVGEDQVAHLELGRESIRRFHNFYGEVLVEPQPLLTPVPRLPGLDNRKMSKSYGNTIDLSDDEETVTKKVRQMYTDPKRVRADIPGTVEGNPVFMYHDAFNPDVAEVEDLKARYRAGKVGDVEVKTKLAKAMNAALAPIRERRREIMARPDRVKEILVEGSRKARGIAQAHDGAGARGGEAAVLTGGQMMTQHEDFESSPDAYTVKLDAFEGPLDLLLFLIRKNEVNIYDIPISLITEQYLAVHRADAGAEPRRGGRVPGDGGHAHPHQVEDAAAPAPTADEAAADDEDPREALVRRLLEHQKYRAAAELLHEREVLRGAQHMRPDERVAGRGRRRLRARARGRICSA